MKRRFGAALLVLLVVASPVVGSLSLIGPAAAGPPGFVSIPDTNVDQDLPPQANIPVTAEQFRNARIMASDHAETLEVTLTTPGHADQVMGSPSDQAKISGDGVALVLSDDTNHDGREIAVRTSVLKEALGHVPQMAFGLHEDGTRWERELTQENGYMVFEVPHFSSNTVTFDGSVNITAKPATDGSTLSYDVADLDGVSDPKLTLTGSMATEWDNVTGSATAPFNTPISVAGTTDPVGPASGEPRLVLTGHESTFDRFSTDDRRGYLFQNGASNDMRVNGPAILKSFNLNVDAFYSMDNAVDIWVSNETAVDGVAAEGTEVYTGWNPTNGWNNLTLPNVPTDGNFTIGFELHESDSTGYVRPWMTNVDSSTAKVSGEGNYYPELYIDTHPGNIEVSDGAGHTLTFGEIPAGTTETKALNLGLSSSTLDVSGYGNLDYDLQFEERTETVDPSVEINANHWLNHTGTLSDGATASFTGSASWIVDGTNVLNVSVGDGTLSADAPTPQVDIRYNHTTTSQQTITYQSQHWSDKYRVNHTYASDTATAQLTIPFEHDILAMRTLKIGFGSGLSAVDQSNYALSSDTLTVDLDAEYGSEIPAGTTVSIVANGSKVQTSNVTISVLEGTPVGGDLDSKLKVESVGTDPYIAVGGTTTEHKLHYLYDESWSADETALIDASDNQHLRLPNVEAGATARVATVPVDVNVTSASGDVALQVTSASTEPTIDVRPGPDGEDASVSYRLLTATTGQEYILWSVSNEVQRDSATASSPVTLLDDDSGEVLQIKASDSTSSSSGGGGGGGTFAPAPPQLSGDLTLPLLALSLLALLGGLYAIRRYASGPSGASADGDAPSGDAPASGRSIPGVSTLVWGVRGLLGGASRLIRTVARWFGARPRVSLGAGVFGSVVLVGTGIVELPSLPDEIAIMLAVVGIPGIAYWILKRTGNYSAPVWYALTALSGLAGLEVLSGNLVQSVAESPAFVLLAIGGLWILRKAVNAWQTPQERNVLQIQTDGGEK